MSKISSNIKERVLYLAEIQEGNKQIFFKNIEMTYGNFTGKSKKTALSSDAISKILLKYPNTNPNWLLLGKGNMLLEDDNKVNDNDTEYHKQCKNCEFLENELKHAKKLIEAKEETISILKEIAAVKKNKAS